MHRPPTGPAAHKPNPAASRPGRDRRRIAFGAVALIVAAAGGAVFLDWWRCLPDSVQATYIGRASCRECHAQEYDLWQGSHHDLAMDRATPETVLGDFNAAEFEQFGIRSRMFRRADKFFVHTEGPDGKLADFEVKYVLGVTPLQNYMVEFDRPADMPSHEIARLQVLRLTWDTPGKKWFYMPPPDVRDQRLAPDDDLHWTGMAQRWNNMCADCHSTNLQKSFDVATKTYHTTFSEIDVSCEACHGPASVHVELARRRSLFWDRKRGYGLARLKGDVRAQIDTCAPCHSRRGAIHPDFRPGERYHDYFINELLSREVYFADGQIQDEDYEYASFLQSKMYHRGIKCADCHDPHSIRPRFQGNSVCTSCHQHPVGKYDSPSHHHHQPDSSGAACVECHMPKTTYMEVDPRLDHSLRVPRPDLSVDLGLPNACTRCHLAKDTDRAKVGVAGREDLKLYQDWVAAARRGDAAVQAELNRLDALMLKAVSEWYGNTPRDPLQRKRHFAYALDAARRGDPEAEPQLIDVAGDGRLPAIVRATALMELAQFGSHAGVSTAVQALGDPDPQVRVAAIENLPSRLEESRLVRELVSRLDDPVRAVRHAAARTLAGVSPGLLRGTERERLQAVIEDYHLGLLVNNDRAGSHLARGSLFESLHADEQAVEAYRTAMQVEPHVTGPRTNLAATCERLAEAAEAAARQAEVMQDETIRKPAADRALAYRQEARELRVEELGLLARDVKLLPNAAGLQYRYGMLLYLQRRFDEAEAALLEASRLEPFHPQFLLGVVLFYRERKQPEKALPLAERLVALRPEDPMYRQVLEELKPR